MKSYTDIEQSKVLAKTLPIESADMRYGYIAPYEYSDRMYDGGYDEIPYPKDFLIKNPNYFVDEYDAELPCWSLAALLDAMPPIQELCSSTDHYYRVSSVSLFSEWHENAIDSCVEIIVRLHKDGLL